MRRVKPIVSLFMALLISVTSLGVAVSAHACSESGYTETGLGHLKACCNVAEGKGFRAEPCCKVSVQHVKLATVRSAHTAVDLGSKQLLTLCLLPPPAICLQAIIPVKAAFPDRPPAPPLLGLGNDFQSISCSFLI